VIFHAKDHNVLGISSMTGAAYQQAWKIASDEIVLILSAAAQAGYHSKKF
jgi:hypothetical protein